MIDTADAPGPLWPPAAEAATRMARRGSVAHAEEAGIADRWLTWPVRRTARAARSSLAAMAVLVAVLRLPSVVDGEWGNFRQVLWFQAATVGWILVATIVVRTITPRHVLSCWLLGVFFAAPVVDGLGAVLEGHVAGNAFTAGVVPVLEEVVKLVPVLWYLVLMRWARRGVGAVDLALLGMAVGGGFAIYEDMLWGRAFATGFEGIGILLPSTLQDPIVAAGHLVWTGCAALGVGILHLHRRTLWAWIAGPLLVVVPVVDHAVVNYRGAEFDAMRDLMVGGRVSSFLLLGGLAVAVAVEHGIVERSRGVDHLHAPVPLPALMTSTPPPLFSARTSPRQLQRARNAAVYRRHTGGDVSPVVVLEVAVTRAAMDDSA